MTSEILQTEVEAPRRRRVGLWVAVSIGIVVALFVAVLATRPPAGDRLAQSPLLGKPAPDVAGTSVLDGQSVRLSSLRGRWVVVNFLASYCVPCAQEHPELVKFAQRHEAAGDGSVLGVIFDDDVNSVKSFFRQRGGAWPVVADPDGQVALDYGVRGPPESFVVEPHGAVVAKLVGQVSADGLDRLIQRGKAQGL